MPRGYRRVIVALGLIFTLSIGIGWFLFPSMPSLESFEYDQPRNEHYRPGGRKCDPSALGAIRNSQVRLDRAEDCQKQAEEYRQSSDDLIQQTRAANAAAAQTDIAGQVLWMGWIQTIGGLLTLAAAVAAAIFARDAAIESRRSANIADSSHKALVHAERAILRVTKVRLRRTLISTEIVIHIINLGRSAAIVRRTTFSCNQDRQIAGIIHLANEAEHNTIIPPDGEADLEIAGMVLSEDRIWFIAGTVEYATAQATFMSVFSSKQEWQKRDSHGVGNQWIGENIACPGLPRET